VDVREVCLAIHDTSHPVQLDAVPHPVYPLAVLRRE
jgi:hypothetical protein